MTAIELLVPAEAAPSNPEWHRLRRAGLSASEIAAVLGISPWDSAFSLHWKKAEGWVVDVSTEMVTGTILEPSIANLWAASCDPHENLTLRPAGLYASAERPWQLATPDRLVLVDQCVCGADDQGRIGDVACSCLPSEPAAVLECKWTGSWDGWGEPGTDHIPVHYRAQVLWQCDVLEIREWCLGLLGPSGFRAYNGAVDRAAERDLVLMRRAGAEFMARLESGQPPPVDDGHPATITTLRKLHPAIEHDDPIEVSPEFAHGWRRARALRKRAGQLCDRYEARARDELKGGRRLTLDNQLVTSRSVYERKPYEVGPATIDKLNPGKVLTHA